MKKFILRLTILLVLLFAPEVTQKAIAQPPPPDIDPEVPIDGGLTALVVAGLVYGARKLRAESRMQ